MSSSDRERLKQLGRGQSIEEVCRTAGLTREEFDAWWRATAESRLPNYDAQCEAAVSSAATIERNELGIPHIFADNDDDLFFGFGLAVAQDRLFQLDYLRRKARGRLAEVLGPEALAGDVTARTVGLHRIAEAEWKRLTGSVRRALEAFSSGVNHAIDSLGDRPPIEFDLLDYRPEPWKPTDCLAIEVEFRWYLTGRLPIIVLPELAKRALGDGPLYRQFLLGECDEESILHPGDYEPAAPQQPAEPVGSALNDPDEAIGSNNWVISGERTTTGLPLLASDPHIAFEAVSCWYQAHLCGGSFNVAGISYVGIPAVIAGRNLRVAWGITNNICSQRDLYQERTDDAHPECFLFDGEWAPASQVRETIAVRDAPSVERTIRFSTNGPIVDELLPAEARHTGPVSLKWLGSHQGGWLTAMLDMNRADSVEAFRQALRPWHVPTFAMVMADVDGAIGFQTAGRIPWRKPHERGYRPGWSPDHQWQGLIPFEAIPRLADPPRGWIATANNRLAPDDFPYPLAGCWSSGWRAMRIRQMIEAQPRLSPDDIRAMQQDAKSLRGVTLTPYLTAALKKFPTQPFQPVVRCLEQWDGDCTPESVATTLFNVFFTHWCEAVAEARFGSDLAPLMATAISGCAGRLLIEDPHRWFQGDARLERIAGAMQRTLAVLTEQLGPELEAWQWKRLHRMPLRHWLSSRGDLGQLLDHGGEGVRGDMVTVCNSGSGPNWSATSGAGYRLVADLAQADPAAHQIDAQSQSGAPFSPHYQDQHAAWLAGKTFELPLTPQAARQTSRTCFRIRPSGNGAKTEPQ